MARRDIVVIGASAGGVAALKELLASLPGDFPGTLFVVLHIPAHSPSQLPQILNQAGSLKAVHPRDGDPIEPGRVYVAPPDRHLLVERNRVLVKNGPKENRFRPSVDALFRSAAYVFGPRVIGIVMSGALDDGTSGLWTIKRQGGVAIVQNPEEAQFPDMPANALEHVRVDHTVSASAMGALLAGLVTKTAPKEPKLSKRELKQLEMEIVIATRDGAFERGIMDLGKLAPFTCPECHGALVRFEEGKWIRFRCHTGHAYTANALLAGITQSNEENLWKAMRGLEESVMLLEHLGEHFKAAHQPEAAELFFEKGSEERKRAQVIHDSILTTENLSADIRHPGAKENESGSTKSKG